jgi:hypothetical protein
MPATRVKMGDITTFRDDEDSDMISMELVSAIEYPVVTLALPHRFYDIRHLIRWAQSTPRFPHNRQPIDWLRGLDRTCQNKSGKDQAKDQVRIRSRSLNMLIYAGIYIQF